MTDKPRMIFDSDRFWGVPRQLLELNKVYGTDLQRF